MIARIDRAKLPNGFPTHRHTNELWEELGRTVATFGFLEEVLGRAIFAVTATKQVSEEEAEAEVTKWIVTLERALDDTLGKLIDSYEKALANRPEAAGAMKEAGLSFQALREANVIRNALCHGSWQPPDGNGRSELRYVDKRRGVFDTAVDLKFLQQTRQGVVELICDVIDSVAHLGLNFPGRGLPLRGEEARGTN